MKIEKSVEFLSNYLKKQQIVVPSLHVVLGSVLTNALSNVSLAPGWRRRGGISFSEIPGFNPATAPGHKGEYRYFENSTGKVLCVQVGRIHGYEGVSAREAVKPVILNRALGTSTFILTNAAGALQKNIRPGSAVILKDHVNLTGQNPLVGATPCGPNGEPLGPRFPDMTAVYDKEIRKIAASVFKNQKIETHEGTYLGLLGPSFETPAEVSLFSSWGLHVVGFSTVWEAISLKHAGAKVVGISLVTNMGCGLTDEHLDHEEFEKNMSGPAQSFVGALFSLAEEVFK